MDITISGNALKTFTRSITCLARVGNELAIQASPSKLAFHTLNSSRSAYQSVTFKPDFFDLYVISTGLVQCSVLLKAVCSLMRTPISGVDRLRVYLPDPDASKVQWTLDCNNGMTKAYWITCNVEPDIQHLSLEREKIPSSFVVKPRDFNRLLANFQSSLQEITVIATEPNSMPTDAANEIGGKAVELRSYIDPTKDDCDASLHTQLWIDPTEEFLEYTHTGDPVDVTFAVKELKAFLSFCEGCEIDIHLFFDKAGEPILMAPKFGLDDGSTSNFDMTLVLATMLASQLQEGIPAEHPPTGAPTNQGRGSQAQHGVPAVSDLPSDHTRIWSELSGSAARSGNATEDRQQTHGQESVHAGVQSGIHGVNTLDIPMTGPRVGNVPADPYLVQRSLQKDFDEEPIDRAGTNGQGWSQHHPSNWVAADEDDDEDESELCVQSTPQY
ncbi:exodeoxyribonuclease III [Ranunculus cassubicifolius]